MENQEGFDMGGGVHFPSDIHECVTKDPGCLPALELGCPALLSPGRVQPSCK